MSQAQEELVDLLSVYLSENSMGFIIPCLPEVLALVPDTHRQALLDTCVHPDDAGMAFIGQLLINGIAFLPVRPPPTDNDDGATTLDAEPNEGYVRVLRVASRIWFNASPRRFLPAILCLFLSTRVVNFAAIGELRRAFEYHSALDGSIQAVLSAEVARHVLDNMEDETPVYSPHWYARFTNRLTRR